MNDGEAESKPMWRNIATTSILVIISLIGIIGNSLVIWVFRGQAKKYRTSGVLILFLAITDLIVCSIDIPLTLAIDVWQVNTNDFVCRIFGGLKGLLLLLSPDILLVIAIERFLVICYTPGIAFRHRHTCLAISIIMLIGVATAVPSILVTGNFSFNNSVQIGPQLLQDDMPLITQEVPQQYGNVCWTDSTYIPRNSYFIYRIVICVLFMLILVMIMIFYTLIFAYVCSRQAKMYERYGPAVKGSWIYLISSSQQNCNENQQGKLKKQKGNGNKQSDKHSSKNLLEIPNEQQQQQADQNFDYINEHQEITEEAKAAAAASQKMKDEILANKSKKRPHVRTAKTLGIISVAFIISYSPHILTTLLRDFKKMPSPGRLSHHDKMATLMFHLYFLSSALNPFIYSCTNNVFKVKVSNLLHHLGSLCGLQVGRPSAVNDLSSNTNERKLRTFNQTDKS